MRLNLPQPYLPFAQGDFPTPSGKCEFYSERMAQDGSDPLPAYTPPAWQQAGAPSSDTNAPLVCISPPAHSFLNSSFVNVDRLRTREGQPLLRIHPADAAARDIADAATVRVWNERGEVHLVAALDDGLAPGTVLAPGVWWAKFSPDRRNVNQLTDQQQSDMGGGASFYDVRVQVAPVAPPAAPEGASPAAVATMRGDDLPDCERKEPLRWIPQGIEAFADVQRDYRSRPPRRPGMRVRRTIAFSWRAGSNPFGQLHAEDIGTQDGDRAAAPPPADRNRQTARLLGIRSTHNLGRRRQVVPTWNCAQIASTA